MLVFVGIVGILCVIPFHVLSLLLGFGRTLESLRHALFAKFGVNHRNRLTFCRTCESWGS
jgi:hypothetical protein